MSETDLIEISFNMGAYKVLNLPTVDYGHVRLSKFQQLLLVTTATYYYSDVMDKNIMGKKVTLYCTTK